MTAVAKIIALPPNTSPAAAAATPISMRCSAAISQVDDIRTGQELTERIGVVELFRRHPFALLDQHPPRPGRTPPKPQSAIKAKATNNSSRVGERADEDDRDEGEDTVSDMIRQLNLRRATDQTVCRKRFHASQICALRR